MSTNLDLIFGGIHERVEGSIDLSIPEEIRVLADAVAEGWLIIKAKARGQCLDVTLGRDKSDTRYNPKAKDGRKT